MFQSFPFFEENEHSQCYHTLALIGSKKDEDEYDCREQKQQSNREREEDQCCTREQGKVEEHDKAVEQDRCTTPGGTVVVVPYRPPSASRTYFMAVSHGWYQLMILIF